MTRDQVFNRLAEMNVALVQVPFSGGNDEGGAEGVYFSGRSPEGTLFSITMPEQIDIHRAYGSWEKDEQGNPFPEGTPLKMVRRADYTHYYVKADEDDFKLYELYEALEKPIYDKYHTFAGEFSVSGTLTWNVADRRVSMTGEESSYVPFEDEF